MTGYEITFFTEKNKKHNDKLIIDWILDTAQSLNIKGATIFEPTEGVNHQGLHHSTRFFELTSQPICLTLILKEEEKELLFTEIRKAKLHVFYSFHQVYFGFTDSED